MYAISDAITLCSEILSDSHLSSLRYSRREAKQARSTTKAYGVAFSSIDRACVYAESVKNGNILELVQINA